MKKLFKWLLIVGGGFLLVVILALLIIPRFIDVQKYKPVIETKISEATGRPFTLGGDLRLSLFPWAGLALSDLHLGSPPGFEEKDFLAVKCTPFFARFANITMIQLAVAAKQTVRFGLKPNAAEAATFTNTSLTWFPKWNSSSIRARTRFGFAVRPGI